jgi:hypothetical protein
MTDQESRPDGSVSSEGLGPLLDDWAEAACVRFVNRSYGQSTTETVGRDDLLQLMRAVQSAECERICAAIKAEDDHCVDRDYMLDSDDCIAVARGQWKRPE